jgi:acetoacetyl-CoA synthetase
MDQSNMVRYIKWLKEYKGLELESYPELWEWSVTQLEEFWGTIWEFFEVKSSHPYTRVLANRRMPGAQWFEGAKLNYAENVFQHMSNVYPALVFRSELQGMCEISWQELHDKVASVAAGLRQMGVEPGDRVAAYMPNIPETVIAFLACVTVGAIWSSCSPDFGSQSVIDRFKQIEPKILFAVDGYQYGGRPFDRRVMVDELRGALSSLKKTVYVPYLLPEDSRRIDETSVSLPQLYQTEARLQFEQVPFDHPLWVLYSSGTTGLPKAIVQGHGGIVLEHYKYLALHGDVKQGDRFFWFSTTGWMMWNVVMGSLLTGGTAVLYDGNPAYPTLDALWEFAEQSKMNVFGTSAAYLTACQKAGLRPVSDHQLDHLTAIGSTGSPLPPEGFQWVYENVGKDIWLVSTSGGTDVCSGFLGGCPLLPVYCGELQCRCLGVKAEAFNDDGQAVIDQVGELVITEPMPSMPLFFWNDPGNQRYIESYFDMFPGVWRHGDWVKITSRGSAVILGRSDSTLNRMGVRMGTSEIYSAVEAIPEVLDSLVVGLEQNDGGYFMPLFVVLREGVELDEALIHKIKSEIRNTLTPRHVPDEIYPVSSIPRTLNGKKLEVPVKKLLMGIPLEQAVNLDSTSNPESFAEFAKFAQRLSSG